MGCRLLALALTLLLLAVASPTRAGQPAGPEILAERIRAEIGAGGARAERALAALRELRDPALKPLFAQLATGPLPEQRRHGILGRAELETPPQLDPFMLGQAIEAQERLAIVESGRREGLLSDEGVRELLTRTDLGPALETYLRLLDAGAGGTLDAARIGALTTENAKDPRATARIALLSMGLDPGVGGPLPAPLSDWLAAPTNEARAHLAQALSDVAHAGWAPAAPFVEATIASRAQDPILRAAAVRALLAIDPERASPAWIEAFDEPEAGYADRLRLALVLLDADDAPQAALERLAANDDTLLRAMGRAAMGLKNADPAPAIDLAAQAYAPAAAWLVRAALESDPDTGRATLTALIDQVAGASAANWDLNEQFIRAAEALALIDADAFLDRLRRATEAGDLRTEKVLLLGALRPAGQAVCAGASGAASNDPECRALAAIALGRSHEGAPTAVMTDLLREVAEGRGGLHPARRVQAAWLALRLSGDERLALARILAPDPS
ncbi:MAG: hypothetical protein IBJ10_04520 [Phycisphaerales bacterium]|nr:hypothetical protein [Phycisphaerales bacterium]